MRKTSRGEPPTWRWKTEARFIDLPSTADFLASQKPRPGYFWDRYHAGIAAGLTGDTSTARRRLDQVLAEDAFAPWMVQAQESARQLHALAEDPEAFRDRATRATTCRRTHESAQPGTDERAPLAMPERSRSVARWSG
ncbi:hypothetical protein ACWCPM_24430, partial [Streptomyces sp. NPDC002309]